MSARQTSEGSAKFTCLQALEGGLTLFDWQASPTITQSGPAPARANRSRSQASAVEPLTLGIYGPSSCDSSGNADLQSCLESKSHLVSSSENRKRKDREYQRIYRRRNRARDLIRHAQFRAGKKNLDFDLDLFRDEIQAIIDIGICQVTGLPLNLDGGRTWDSPSLDRIDPQKGYTLDNVRVVCHALNSALGDWGIDRFLNLAKAIQNKRRDASNALSIKLGENLMKRLPDSGSPEYKLTWSVRDIPLGRVCYQQRASARRISGNGCIGVDGWRTPRLRDHHPCGQHTSGNPDQIGLAHQAELAGWKTPHASDGEGGVMEIRPGADGHYKLRDVATLAGCWPPCQPNGGHTSRSGERQDEPLMGGIVRGMTPTGTSAATESTAGFRLNPRFSAWLMGYPLEWTRAGQRTFSRLRRRKKGA